MARCSRGGASFLACSLTLAASVSGRGWQELFMSSLPLRPVAAVRPRPLEERKNEGSTRVTTWGMAGILTDQDARRSPCA